jgi:hypothetical protein
MKCYIIYIFGYNGSTAQWHNGILKGRGEEGTGKIE